MNNKSADKIDKRAAALRDNLRRRKANAKAKNKETAAQNTIKQLEKGQDIDANIKE